MAPEMLHIMLEKKYYCQDNNNNNKSNNIKMMQEMIRLVRKQILIMTIITIIKASLFIH